MRASLKSSLVGLAIALTPALAHAQDAANQYPPCDKTPTDGEVEGAKGAFKAGQASFEEGDYNRAISYWEDAYRRDCTAHALLLNLARAYELNNQRQQAVGALETYLSRNPSSPQRDQIARRIDVLKEKIAADKNPAAPGTGPGPGEVKPVTVEPTKPTTGSRPLTPLFVAGGGAALTLVGGILYLGASSDVKDIEDKCGGRKCKDQGLIDDGNSARSRQTLWGIVTVSGIAVTAGGLVWYFMQKPEAPKSAGLALHRMPKHPRVDPVVSPGFAGLALSGQF